MAKPLKNKITIGIFYQKVLIFKFYFAEKKKMI